MYDLWVQLETNKLKKFAHKGESNYGVFGRTTLPEVLAKARKKTQRHVRCRIDRAQILSWSLHHTQILILSFKSLRLFLCKEVSGPLNKTAGYSPVVFIL